MKNPFALPLICIVFLTGCSMLASKPPSPLETKLFDIRTNQVPVVLTQTNVVTVTQTNVVNVRNPVTEVMYRTNEITIQTVGTNIVTVTNLVPAYEFTPKPASLEAAQAVGTVTNGFLPGFGGLITTGLTGLLGLWATLRTKKQGNQIAANLTQAIETARSVIKSLPNGAAVGSKFDAFLVAHQEDADLAGKIGAIVDQFVSADEATGAATKIINLVSTPLTSPPAVAAVPSNG